MSEGQIQQNKIDQSVMDTLRTHDHTALAQQVNRLMCEHNDIVELLAKYMALSELDDERFDDWYDNLSSQQHTVLKVFEIYRGQYEHQN